MTWRHLAILVFWIVFIAVLAQAWVTSFVKPAPPPAAIEAPRPAPVTGVALVEIIDYATEPIDPYRMDVHFKAVNRGTRAARNIRIVLNPWKYLPSFDRGESLPEDAPMRQINKLMVIETLKPNETLECTMTFSVPDYILPSNAIRKGTFEVTFESE